MMHIHTYIHMHIPTYVRTYAGTYVHTVNIVNPLQFVFKECGGLRSLAD